MNNVMFIGAHPDDVELGCGGTIYKYSQMGYEILVLIIAEGSSARYDDLEQNKDLINKQITERKESCKKSLTNLGVKKFKFFDLPCGRLDTVPLLDINKIIEKQLNIFKPNTIFTHSSVDTNKDHRIIFESTKIATRPFAYPSISRIYSYEVLSSTECSYTDVFKPNHFVSLNKQQINKKVESLNFYKSEMRDYPNPRSPEGIETLAKFRGMQIGKHYAESFEVLKSWS
tara:strand:- start:280 stop:966 length:687 start_codon:yes stop_codon:yes gene_type:complete